MTSISVCKNSCTFAADSSVRCGASMINTGLFTIIFSISYVFFLVVVEGQ
jgi:hypothetical protein